LPNPPTNLLHGGDRPWIEPDGVPDDLRWK
jgi:hypothetical protein